MQTTSIHAPGPRPYSRPLHLTPPSASLDSPRCLLNTWVPGWGPVLLLPDSIQSQILPPEDSLLPSSIGILMLKLLYFPCRCAEGEDGIVRVKDLSSRSLRSSQIPHHSWPENYSKKFFPLWFFLFIYTRLLLLIALQLCSSVSRQIPNASLTLLMHCVGKLMLHRSVDQRIVGTDPREGHYQYTLTADYLSTLYCWICLLRLETFAYKLLLSHICHGEYHK